MTPIKTPEARAREYARGCDNESGAFLSRDLESIRIKGYLAGYREREEEVETLKEELKWRRGVHGITGEVDSLRNALAEARAEIERLRKEVGSKAAWATKSQRELQEARAQLAVMREALQAAKAYDSAICKRAQDGTYHIDAGGAIAEGVDLDALYEDWISKTKAALDGSEARRRVEGDR